MRRLRTIATDDRVHWPDLQTPIGKAARATAKLHRSADSNLQPLAASAPHFDALFAASRAAFSAARAPARMLAMA